MNNCLTRWVHAGIAGISLMGGVCGLVADARATCHVEYINCPLCAGEAGNFSATPGSLLTFKAKADGCAISDVTWTVTKLPSGNDAGWTKPYAYHKIQLSFSSTFPDLGAYAIHVRFDPEGAEKEVALQIQPSAFTVNIIPSAGCAVIAGDGGVDAVETDGIACAGGMAATSPLCREQFKNADLAALKVAPEAGYGFNGWIVDGAHMQMTSAEPLFLSTRPVLADNGSCAQVKNGSTNTQADCVLNALTLYRVDHGKAIPAKDKATIGAYLSINRDDDNGDGQPDNANTVLDDDEDRRDLAKITLKAAGQTETFTMNADTPGLVRVFDEAGTAVNLPATVTPAQLTSGLTYWVEGLTKGTAFVSVKNANGTLEDKVKFVVGEEIGIKLTFDDGPDSRTDTTTVPTVSRTQRLLNMLKNNSVIPNIKATFFVQTHCTSPYGGGVPKDAKHPMSGEELIKAIANDGHHVEVHTGNNEGHNGAYYHTEQVKEPRYDADDDGDKDAVDGDNALEGDLIRAKARITSWTRRVPLLVRPPAREFNDIVQQFYTKQQLTMQLWDVDTQDYTNNDSVVIGNLSTTEYGGIPFWIKKGKTSLVILFHDVKENTVKNIESYLKVIENLVQHEGRNVRFEQF